MKAIILHAPLDLRVDDIPSPAQPCGEQVLIRVRRGGICGSDLHYYHAGGFGNVRIREPMILGHEIVGEISAIGPDVTGLAVHQRVAINPGRVPTPCQYTRAGLTNHALDMRFYGSAMRFPHVQGGFCEQLLCEASQLVKLLDTLDFAQAAFAEPLAVCLHACRQAGDLLNRRVLISGAGPIGVLTTLVARHAGAREIVVTDILDAPLEKARCVGASRTINVNHGPDALGDYEKDKGYFDVAIECSGSGAGLDSTLRTTRPRGHIVQVGMGNTTTIALATLVSKELVLKGTFRFVDEFEEAVATLARSDVDISPLLSEVFPIERALDAFELAGDKSRAMKVQIAF